MTSTHRLTHRVGGGASLRHGFRYGIEINGNGASGSKVEGNYIGTDVSGEQNRDLLVKEDGSLTERGEAIVDHTPAGRFGEPDELVGTLLWLCGPGASFVTGVVVPVDGGFSAFSGGLACGCYSSAPIPPHGRWNDYGATVAQIA